MTCPGVPTPLMQRQILSNRIRTMPGELNLFEVISQYRLINAKRNSQIDSVEYTIHFIETYGFKLSVATTRYS